MYNRSMMLEIPTESWDGDWIALICGSWDDPMISNLVVSTSQCKTIAILVPNVGMQSWDM